MSSDGSQPNEANVDTLKILDRRHDWMTCRFISAGLSLCITVDILQYSMPLAFLPSVLEDRGHSPMKIATAIGVYYWMGFAGGAIITGYQVWRLVKGARSDEEDVLTIKTVRRQIHYLVIGLLIGMVTLMCQALYPRCWMHTVCRFVQGFAGAFLFFYTFLLSSVLFEDKQRNFSLTMAATALNIAEVIGSTLGAVLYDTWGQAAVFWFLGIVSFLNQIWLFSILYAMKEVDATTAKQLVEQAAEKAHRVGISGWQRLKILLASKRLHLAVILIVMAAVVKGAVEEMLPFHADHRWGLTPLQIGWLFGYIAIAYISASLSVYHVWEHIERCRVLFSAFWLAMLGSTAWLVFITATYSKNTNHLVVGLVLYGLCLGLTHTPATLFLGLAIEKEDGVGKDAVNGIWNTMWEAGGSLGFLLGGLLAEDYGDQIDLVTGCAVCCLISAGLMLMVANYGKEDKALTIYSPKTYGTEARTP